MNYQFADILGRSRWLIEPSALKRLIVAAAEATPEAIDARIQALSERAAMPAIVGDVAVINVFGPITYRDTYFSMYFGGASVERLQAQFRTALNDPAIKAIVFRIDSPGGTVDGVSTFAAEVFKARGQKPILAISDTLCASAALWIGAQADQLFVEPTSQTGSIGVLMAHQDVSKMLDELGVKITLIFAGLHKVDGNPFEPLPDEVKERFQAEVDDVRAEFLSAVGRARGVSAADVRKSYGEGLCYSAKDAVKLGLADKIATFDGVLALAPKASSKARRAEAEPIAPLATLGEIAGETSASLTLTVNQARIDAAVEQIQTEAEAFEQRAQAIAQQAITEAVGFEPAPAAVSEAQLAADRDYADLGVRIAERL